MPANYLDFDLLIQRLPEGYRARVVNSPAGEASIDFQVPFSPLELENFVLRIGRTLSQFRRDTQGVRRLETTEREAIKQFGGRLFDTVFTDDVEGCLRASLNEAYRRDAGLRIRLRLGDTPELADIPWEYLYSPALNRFFGLSPETPVVRYLELAETPRPLAVRPPLRVLVMISSPMDYPSLDIAQEWEKLEEAVAGLQREDKVTLARLETATLSELQRQIRRNEPHVFHFIGHGGFIEQAQDGALVLEDQQHRGRFVSGQDLGMLLLGHRSLRLAVLNACEGARGSQSDPFAGVAQSLVQQGVPAVIAMQFEITDRAAITFAQEFYGAVADGYPVDAALTEARRAIFAGGFELEWATPVLYMRSPNGRLFRIERRAAPVATPEPAAPAREPAPSATEPHPASATEPHPLDERLVPQRPGRTGGVLPVRTAGPPAAWWWVLAFGGAALVAVGMLLPSFRISGESKPIVDTPWSALEPLAAVLGVVAAALGVVRAGVRGLVRGLLVGFGVYVVLLYLAYVLVAIKGNDALGIDSSGAAGGAFVGLAGAMLLVWAGLSLPMADDRVSARGSGVAPALAVGVGLVFFGAAILLLATIAFPLVMAMLGLPIGFGTTSATLMQVAVEQATLLQIASPLALPPLGVAVATALCGFAILRLPPRSPIATGIILALAIESLLFQFTLIAATPPEAAVGTGGYLGMAAGGMMLAGAILIFRAALRAPAGIPPTGPAV